MMEEYCLVMKIFEKGDAGEDIEIFQGLFDSKKYVSETNESPTIFKHW